MSGCRRGSPAGRRACWTTGRLWGCLSQQGQACSARGSLSCPDILAPLPEPQRVAQLSRGLPQRDAKGGAWWEG